MAKTTDVFHVQIIYMRASFLQSCGWGIIQTTQDLLLIKATKIKGEKAFNHKKWEHILLGKPYTIERVDRKHS